MGQAARTPNRYAPSAESCCESTSSKVHRPASTATQFGFLVVGDIGEAGPARERLARAVGQVVEREQGRWSFILSTGDNFYNAKRWKSTADEEAAFTCLEQEMLRHVPLPWYLCLGNHDVKEKVSKLHLRKHGTFGNAPEDNVNSEGTGRSWTWRCPSSHAHRLCDDWDSNPAWPPFPSHLVDIFVVNTSKFQMLLDRSFDWDEQKRWVREGLRNSNASWKIVVGHHPIEYLPYSFAEHALKGVKYFTTTFMKGGVLNKMNPHSFADAIITGGANAYICGHQHLMAHLVRLNLPRRLAMRSRDVRSDCQYMIVGSSSKTEQDEEDFASRRHVSDESEVAHSQEKDGEDQLSSPGGSPRTSPRSPTSNCKSSKPVKWQYDKVKNKMRELWWKEEVGFATVEVNNDSLTMEYFVIGADGAGNPQSAFRHVVERSDTGFSGPCGGT